MRRGFTLLEVLLAVALTALVFALLGGVVVGIIDAERRVTERTQATKYASGILNIMSADLQACYIYQQDNGFMGQSGSEPQLHFITTRDGLPDPETGVRPSTTEVSYILEETDDSDGLYTLYRRTQSPVDETPFEGGTAFEVYDRILEFTPEFQTADGAWLSDWQATDKLPWAVRITLKLIDAEALPQGADPERIRAFTTTIFIPCAAEEEEPTQ